MKKTAKKAKAKKSVSKKEAKPAKAEPNKEAQATVAPTATDTSKKAAKDKAKTDVSAQHVSTSVKGKAGDKVKSATSDNLKDNANFKKLDQETQKDVLTRMDAAKGNALARKHIVDIATSEGFGKLNGPHRKQTLDALGKAPANRKLAEDLKDLTGNAEFRNLNDQTKSQFLQSMAKHSGDADARKNMAELATHQDFQQLNPDHQKQMIQTLDKAPKDEALREDLQKLASNPDFRGRKDGTKTELLNSLQRHPTDKTARANLTGVATNADFDKLSPDHRKQMLQTMEKSPGDTKLADNLKKISSSDEYLNLNDKTKTEVLDTVGKHAKDPAAHSNITGLATTKGFSKLGVKHQKELMQTLEKAPTDAGLAADVNKLAGSKQFANLNDGTKSQVLSSVGKHATDADARKNVMDLASHPDFSKVSANHQKQMLEAQAKAPKDKKLTEDLKKLTSDADFRGLNDGIKSAVIKTYGDNTDPKVRARALELARSAPFKAAYHKADATDKKALEKLLTSPNGDRAVQSFSELKKLQAKHGKDRLTDDMVRTMTTGTADSRTNQPTGIEGMLSPAQSKRAGQALINMPKKDYDRFKAVYDKTGIGKDGKAIAGADPETQKQVLLKTVAARKNDLVSGKAAKSTKAMKEVTDFAPKIRKMGKQDLVDNTTMLDVDHSRNTSRVDPNDLGSSAKNSEKLNKDAVNTNDGHYQKYTTSCGPTSMQTIKGENDPIYAYKTKNDKFSDPSMNTKTAKEQKKLLNRHGGRAKLRAAQHDYNMLKAKMDSFKGGKLSNDQHAALDKYLKKEGPKNKKAKEALVIMRKEMGGFPSSNQVKQIRDFKITNPHGGTGFSEHKKMLDKHLKKHTGVKYDQEKFASGGLGAHLNDADKALKKGHDVPIGVCNPAHWMSMSDVRGKSPNRKYLVHDNWSGKTLWVTETNLKNGSFLKNQFNLGTGGPTAYVDSVYIPKE